MRLGPRSRSMSKNRKVVAAIFLSLSAIPSLWAAKEFTPTIGQSVQPDQLIVKLKAGATIGQVIASVAPGATATLVSSHQNSYLLQLPPGIQSLVSTALAASSLIEFVEPNGVRKVNVNAPNDPSYGSQWALTNIQA